MASHAKAYSSTTCTTTTQDGSRCRLGRVRYPVVLNSLAHEAAVWCIPSSMSTTGTTTMRGGGTVPLGGEPYGWWW